MLAGGSAHVITVAEAVQYNRQGMKRHDRVAPRRDGGVSVTDQRSEPHQLNDYLVACQGWQSLADDSKRAVKLLSPDRVEQVGMLRRHLARQVIEILAPSLYADGVERPDGLGSRAGDVTAHRHSERERPNPTARV